MPCLNYEEFNLNLSNLNECRWLKSIDLNSSLLKDNIKSEPKENVVLSDYFKTNNKDSIKDISNNCMMCNFKCKSSEQLTIHSMNCPKSSMPSDACKSKFVICTRSTKRLARKKKIMDYLYKTSYRSKTSQNFHSNKYTIADVRISLTDICKKLPYDIQPHVTQVPETQPPETQLPQNSQSDFFEYLNLFPVKDGDAYDSNYQNEETKLLNIESSLIVDENTSKLPLLKVLKQDISSEIGAYLYKDHFHQYSCNEILPVNHSNDGTLLDSDDKYYPITFKLLPKHFFKWHNYKFPSRFRPKCLKATKETILLKPCVVLLEKLSSEEIEFICQSLCDKNFVVNTYCDSKTLKTYSKTKLHNKLSENLAISETPLLSSEDEIPESMYVGCKSLIEDNDGNNYMNGTSFRFKCHLCSIVIVFTLDTTVDIRNHFAQYHSIQNFDINKHKLDTGALKLSLSCNDSSNLNNT